MADLYQAATQLHNNYNASDAVDVSMYKYNASDAEDMPMYNNYNASDMPL